MQLRRSPIPTLPGRKEGTRGWNEHDTEKRGGFQQNKGTSPTLRPGDSTGGTGAGVGIRSQNSFAKFCLVKPNGQFLSHNMLSITTELQYIPINSLGTG